MRTLHEAIDKMKNSGGAAASLRKHLTAAGINEWADFSRAALYDLRDELAGSVKPGTARTICANVKALLNRYSDELNLPADFARILSVKIERPRRTFLTTKELSDLEIVQVKNAREKIVLVESLIEAYTGARISDVMTFTEENFRDGYLVYTSIKTKVTASVPIAQKTKDWIRYAQEHRADEPTLAGRNIIIRRLARRAGINAVVKVFQAGEELQGEKWKFLSSHSFRITTATNLSLAGATLTDIKNCLGHSSESMSARYVASTRPNLSPKAMSFFGV